MSDSYGPFGPSLLDVRYRSPTVGRSSTVRAPPTRRSSNSHTSSYILPSTTYRQSAQTSTRRDTVSTSQGSTYRPSSTLHRPIRHQQPAPSTRRSSITRQYTHGISTTYTTARTPQSTRQPATTRDSDYVPKLSYGTPGSTRRPSISYDSSSSNFERSLRRTATRSGTHEQTNRDWGPTNSNLDLRGHTGRTFGRETLTTVGRSSSTVRPSASTIRPAPQPTRTLRRSTTTVSRQISSSTTSASTSTHRSNYTPSPSTSHTSATSYTTHHAPFTSTNLRHSPPPPIPTRHPSHRYPPTQNTRLDINGHNFGTTPELRGGPLYHPSGAYGYNELDRPGHAVGSFANRMSERRTGGGTRGTMGGGWI